jgi:hypothetical protein
MMIHLASCRVAQRDADHVSKKKSDSLNHLMMKALVAQDASTYRAGRDCTQHFSSGDKKHAITARM